MGSVSPGSSVSTRLRRPVAERGDGGLAGFLGSHAKSRTARRPCCPDRSGARVPVRYCGKRIRPRRTCVRGPAAEQLPHRQRAACAFFALRSAAHFSNSGVSATLRRTYQPIGPSSRPNTNGTRHPHCASCCGVSAVLKPAPNSAERTVASPWLANWKLPIRPRRPGYACGGIPASSQDRTARALATLQRFPPKRTDSPGAIPIDARPRPFTAAGGCAGGSVSGPGRGCACGSRRSGRPPS